VRRDGAARKKIRDIFLNEIGGAIPVFLAGTEFQRKVWRELISIPDGSVATYSGIASAIGHPHAARAVGAACGANPVAWLIPCHRVICGTGAVDGYRWGTARKRSMLATEAAALKERKKAKPRSSGASPG
jgi:AraC family transcriptional regulator of adaptative response/methylated-DNA-[protein]-cysteine methyltransferase